MRKYYHILLRLGIQPGDDVHLQNRYMVLNGISISILLYEIVISVMDFHLGNMLNFWIHQCGIWLLSLPVLLLNYKRKIAFARWHFFFLAYTIAIYTTYDSLVKGVISGTENYLIVGCLFVALSFDGLSKYILYLVCALSFLAIKFALPYYVNASFLSTNLSASVLILGTTFGFAEVLKRSYLLSQNIILQQNEKLNQQALTLQQQTIKLQDANRMRENLFAIVCHDLRSPLIALREFFLRQLNIPKPPSNWEQTKHQLSLNINNLCLLTDNLLYWSIGQTKGFKKRIQKIYLTDVIDDVLELGDILIQSKQLSLQKQLTPFELEADPTHLQIIVSNLIHNAIKFSPYQGVIQLAAVRLSDTVELTIRNMVTTQANYSDFDTPPKSGTGLGLALATDLCQLNGGTLTYCLQPDGTFLCRLVWLKPTSL